MQPRTQRRLGLLMVFCLPLFMAASCDSNDLDTADGVIAIIIGIVQLVFTIIEVF